MEIIRVVSKTKIRKIGSQKGEFEVRFQEADLLMENGRSRPTEVQPPRDKEYPLGLYTIAPDSFTTGNYDKIELKKYVDLMSLPDAISAAEDVLKQSRK